MVKCGITRNKRPCNASYRRYLPEWIRLLRSQDLLRHGGCDQNSFFESCSKKSRGTLLGFFVSTPTQIFVQLHDSVTTSKCLINSYTGFDDHRREKTITCDKNL